MKRKRFSVEQIVSILKQAELGMPVAEAVRRVGVSEQAYIGGRSSAQGWKQTRCGSSSNCDENGRL